MFLKNSFLLFLNRTSTASKACCPAGNDILESQSKTVSLLQPSVPQVPLFLHPRGCPPAPVEQLLHPMFNILVPCRPLCWRPEFGSYLNPSVNIGQFWHSRRGLPNPQYGVQSDVQDTVSAGLPAWLRSFSGAFLKVNTSERPFLKIRLLLVFPLRSLRCSS